ncbi:MAG: prepilin-type N-terminal cleavage/methylation domain-containing protein [Candidatus Marinamargulisbacteria bacterium]|jgi:prepilin-type N-terminal cleavage/methylation domain-containing protein
MFKEKGFTLIELTAAMAITAMLAAGAAIVFDAHLKDGEEFSHIKNAQTAAVATQTKILQENIAPDEGANTTFTLQDLYDDDRLTVMIDPSSGESESAYASGSTVTVENVSPTGSAQATFKFYVKLTNSGGDYVYVDESDLTDAGKVDAKDLTRDAVEIPKRNATGL